ncbi:hypothetical protein MYK68_04095 [Gordonia sp. PP30]|uniref:hypothetical protein n=1 Tax=Gordonia sp. PP30 TaxID=2935861 RepID=UPI001FFFBE90|nr:hypothetical protein [Gordonia sp. PP30]UQE75801.1 hypothetical protein MYK68_04095 [Gordonia sp. PP30]
MTNTTVDLPLRERIRQANTGLQHANTVRDQINRFAATRHAHNVDTDYTEKLHAGADPAELIDDYCAAKLRENAENAFGALTANVLQRVADPRSHEEHFAETALAMCRDELDAIFTRVDQHRDLIAEHPMTAEAALNGNIDDYQTVQKILSDYDALRAEYVRQIRLLNPAIGGATINGIQARDFLAIDPYWARKRAVVPISDSYPEPQIVQWFRSGHTIKPLAPNQWILAVADHQPWLPTPVQLDTIVSQLEQLCSRPWHSATAGTDRGWFTQAIAAISSATSG